MTTLIEPTGWGPPGTVRHAEAIGHTAWIEAHRKVSLAKKPPRFTLPPTPKCLHPLCGRDEHPDWQPCEDGTHFWFAEEAPR